jgi:hypothetical protein
LNKLLFAIASAAFLYGAVAASAQGLPFMLHATTDQPSYVDQLPSRAKAPTRLTQATRSEADRQSPEIAPGKLASMAGPSGM